MNLKGRHTLTAFNSVGIAYSWNTNIHSITEENNSVTIIHKPKGSKTHYKHIYNKDQELKLFSGWLPINLQNDVMVSYDESVFNQLAAYENK
jgi:hypothetical protein